MEGGPGRRPGETSYKVSGVRGQESISRAQPRRTPVISIPHAGGTVHEPEVILAKIMEAAQ